MFDAATGALVGDTGGQIDAAADAVGCYPDGRSDSKGTEPENLVVFAAGGTVWAAAGLEQIADQVKCAYTSMALEHARAVTTDDAAGLAAAAEPWAAGGFHGAARDAAEQAGSAARVG